MNPDDDCENWESFLDLTQLSEARWASSNELSSWNPDIQRDGDDGEDDIYEYGDDGEDDIYEYGDDGDDDICEYGVEVDENWVGDDEEEFDQVDIFMQKTTELRWG